MKKLLFLTIFSTCIGSLNAETCNRNNIIPAHNYGMLEVGDDGTVLDPTTGLMWARCTLGRIGNNCENGQIQSYTWEDALVAATTSDLAGYDDWRLPDPKELMSIVDPQCMFPAIDLDIFPDVPITQSPLFYVTSYGIDGGTYTVTFQVGGIYFGLSKLDPYHLVRLVRGGHRKQETE